MPSYTIPIPECAYYVCIPAQIHAKGAAWVAFHGRENTVKTHLRTRPPRHLRGAVAAPRLLLLLLAVKQLPVLLLLLLLLAVKLLLVLLVLLVLVLLLLLAV